MLSLCGFLLTLCDWVLTILSLFLVISHFMSCFLYMFWMLLDATWDTGVPWPFVSLRMLSLPSFIGTQCSSFTLLAFVFCSYCLYMSSQHWYNIILFWHLISEVWPAKIGVVSMCHVTFVTILLVLNIYNSCCGHCQHGQLLCHTSMAHPLLYGLIPHTL